MLEVGVPARLRRDLGDVELIADVAVEREALFVNCGDHLASELERYRHVTEPPSRLWLGDHGALVADDWVVDAGLECVRPYGLEHAAGDEDDVDPLVPEGADCGARARPQYGVLADQRAVEVAGDGLDVARKVVREVQPWGFVRKSTRACKSAGGSCPYDFGMTPFGKPGWMYLSGSTIDSLVNASSGWPACFAY
jgi:hypothetical protein